MLAQERVQVRHVQLFEALNEHCGVVLRRVRGNDEMVALVLGPVASAVVGTAHRRTRRAAERHHPQDDRKTESHR